jgi:hypothetical protein
VKNVIYPKGSIVKTGDNSKKYCIINVTRDGYEVVEYPVGQIYEEESKFIYFDEVKSLIFWGLMDEEYRKMLIEIELGDVNVSS